MERSGVRKSAGWRLESARGVATSPRTTTCGKRMARARPTVAR